MEDLFRFLLLRPADPADPQKTTALSASALLQEILRGARDRASGAAALARLRELGRIVTLPDDLVFGTAMAEVSSALGGTPQAAGDVDKQVTQATGSSATELSNDARFRDDVERLSDTLIALKLASNTAGLDPAMLVSLAHGYDAVRQVAAKASTVRARTFVVPGALFSRGAAPDGTPGSRDPVTVRAGAPAQSDVDARIGRIDEAIATLQRTALTAFAPSASSEMTSISAGDESRPAVVDRASPTIALPPATLTAAGAAHDPAAAPMAAIRSTAAAIGAAGRAWELPRLAVADLPPSVKDTLQGVAGPEATSLPVTELGLALVQARDGLTAERTMSAMQSSAMNGVTKIGSNWYPVGIAGIAGPIQQLPTTSGAVRPIGIGDLLLVRENVKAYEAGEVAHIENVLRSEKLSRETRRLERTVQSITVETEKTKEEERDTQTTERFSLKRETNDTINTDAQLKAGVSVDAKYGPMVEVKANLDGSYEVQTQSATQQASEYSKEVVTRSVSKLTEKVREARTTVTTTEFEEWYQHGFDNTAGTTNISGVYQWIDKVSEAQVYNYGKRLLFDVIVPEPADFYVFTQTKQQAEGVTVTKPAPFTALPQDLDGGSYQVWAQEYGATGIDPPPPLFKTASKAWDAANTADPPIVTKSDSLAIEDGYSAISARLAYSGVRSTDDDASCNILVGPGNVNCFSGANSVNLVGETGAVPLGLKAYKVQALAVTIEVLTQRSNRVWQQWQEKAHAAIAQAYAQRVQEYEQALSEAKAEAFAAVAGRNPLANKAMIAAELRKACIAELTAQQFDTFGAMSTSGQGYPELDLAQTDLQGRYIRFFEQAFEWEHIIYFFFPYFWSRKTTWPARSLYDDVDPLFADYLRAGAARVVFPVRPGFEQAVVHFLETGEIWNGGDPPDISSTMYVSIVQEIQEAQGKPGSEVPQGDPWNVRTPTTLVKLRADDSLPAWKHVGDEWVPAN